MINNDADDRAVMIIILDDEKNYVEKLVINVGFGSLAGQTSSCGPFVRVLSIVTKMITKGDDDCQPHDNHLSCC